MPDISSGNSQISMRHQASRAKNDAEVKAVKDETQAAKNQAAENAKSAFDEINKNDSSTFTGSIKEFGSDLIDAGKAGVKSAGATIYDAASDALCTVENALYDAGSHVAETFDKGVNMAGNTVAAAKGGVKGMFNLLTGLGKAASEGADQAIDDRQNG